MKTLQKDKLQIYVCDSRADMGKKAAEDIREAVKKVISEKGSCNMIFAAAPSQNDMLAQLISFEDIDWTKVNAYHMDEYIGLASDAPQGFANFLRNAIFDRVPFASVNCLNSEADPKEECVRYSTLLEENPTDIVCMGIGENGHIAFNDPHEADFQDKSLVKIVTLDEVCRMQQVHDGCFEKLDDVPKQALTLTIPALVCPAKVFCVVPAKAKAEAVKNTVHGPIEESCPASILRTHECAGLYLDQDSAGLLEEV